MIDSMLLVPKILKFPLIPYWSSSILILSLLSKKWSNLQLLVDSALNPEKSKGTEGKYHKQSNYSLTLTMYQIKWDVFNKRNFIMNLLKLELKS